MRIYSMTATFGKLEHQTLKLEPGLTVIHAPNEWGKSTWCAFLLAMLYGLDTRSKSTRNSLAGKERFAPWSGSPMSGRIELNWNGRDITIERYSKGRIPLGAFRAYETGTGLEVPELTAANCGSLLLGAEQSVFRRSGFIRLSDLPITQDDALRRRLNALVTTGDESGDGARLEKELRDLKNHIRYNRSGLLPQAEAQLERTHETLSEIDRLYDRQHRLKEQLRDNQILTRQLKNHLDALAYSRAQQDASRVAHAKEERDAAQAALEEAQAACAPLPSREEAEEKLLQLQQFQLAYAELHALQRTLPPLPDAPAVPKPFRGMSPEEAAAAAEEDRASYLSAASRGWMFSVFLSLLLLAGAAWSILSGRPYFAAAAAFSGAVFFLLGIFRKRELKSRRKAIADKYRSTNPNSWMSLAKSYTQEMRRYQREQLEYQSARSDLDSRMDALRRQHASLCGEATPEQMIFNWQQVIRAWKHLERTEKEAALSDHHFEVLTAMAEPAALPQFTDTLELSRESTLQQLEDARAHGQLLEARLSEIRGQLETLGDEQQLRSQESQIAARIAKLEDTYAALELAQQTLRKASAELQRRFAPRISGRAQELLAEMTDGQYTRLMMDQNFSLRSGSAQEDTLREALWHSDGTVDQLYLAIRLAVSEELMPEAPIILDDALVRFDQERMEAALRILKELSESRQILLFSCQERERDALARM